MIFLDGFTNLLESARFDHALGTLKACFERLFNRERPFVIPVHRYGVAGIIFQQIGRSQGYNIFDCDARCVN